MITIRRAARDDHAVYVRLFALLEIPDPVPGVDRFVERVAREMWLACTEAGDVVGYVTWRAYGTTAHVVQLAVDTHMRGQRIGEQLLEHVRGEARAAGCTDWYLNVKRDNTAAIRLYERIGLRPLFESVAIRIAWSHVPALAVRERLAREDEDAAIAARFGFPVERLAMFRARARMVTLRDDADTLLGFAPFDPSFPGTPTFCAIRPELAGSLLAAMRVHADPAFDFVRISIEGDRPLADAVLALGGELTFEILRLGSRV